MRIKSTYWKILILSYVPDYVRKDNMSYTVLELCNYKNTSEAQTFAWFKAL